MTGINITLVRFALEQGYDFLRISQQDGVAGRFSSANLQVPFTVGPGDITIDFTSDGRGLHSSTLLGLQLNLNRYCHGAIQGF